MQIVRRDALRVLGAGLGGSVALDTFSQAFAAPPESYVDRYCYCSDILVSVTPRAALDVIATGDKHSIWASSIKREVKPGVWVGRSIFTGKESIHLHFNVDPKRYLVDYVTGPTIDTPIAQMTLVNWARVLPGQILGYPEGSSLVALYQPRRATTSLDSFLESRTGHDAEMYRIKLLAEQSEPTPPDALLTGEYLASYSEQVAVSTDALFDFVSDGMVYGKYTWGRFPRVKTASDTFRCKSDFGGPDIFLRLDVDRARKTVDYYVGLKPDAMSLNQSARVFDGPTFGYDPKVSLVVFTRWRKARESAFEWDRAKANQVEDTVMTKSNLENGVRE